MKWNTDFIVKKMDGYSIALNRKDTGKIMKLNRTATEILEWIREGTESEKQLAEKLAEKYRLEIGQAEADTQKVLSEMKEFGVLNYQ